MSRVITWKHFVNSNYIKPSWFLFENKLYRSFKLQAPWMSEVKYNSRLSEGLPNALGLYSLE